MPMRTITLAPELLAHLFAAATEPFVGIPIVVDWPEVQLSADQRLANALAVRAGTPAPHADPSVFLLLVPVVTVSDDDRIRARGADPAQGDTLDRTGPTATLKKAPKKEQR